MALKTYPGGCHCGAVRFNTDVDLSKGTLRCNCSLCYKARAWFAFVSPKEFRLEKGEAALGEYQWTPPGRPAPNLRYRFCTNCGVRCFVTGKGPKGEDVVALAVAALEGTDADELAASIKYVDGAHNQFGKPPEDTRLL